MTKWHTQNKKSRLYDLYKRLHYFGVYSGSFIALLIAGTDWLHDKRKLVISVWQTILR